jgi:TetR/AcrR family transcriptional regulator
MNERLEALPDDKRRSILSASLAEFAEHGYLNASTNRIVKAAGISKGLLFHYFGNKKGLFLFVLDYTIKYLMEKMNEYATHLSGDFFEQLGQYAMIKTRIGIEEPEMYHILYDVYVNLPAEIKNELLARYGAILSDQREAFMHTMDASKLREGVTVEAAANLMIDFLDGYYQRNIEKYKTMTPDELLDFIGDMKKEIMGYLGIIKRGIYKDGE